MPEYFQGDWVVVTRTVGEDASRGLIVSYHKRRYQAVQEAAEWREAGKQMGSNWHVYTMRRADY